MTKNRMLSSENNIKKRGRTELLVLMSILSAVALCLSFIENMLPPLPIPVPGVKFGLANIVVMFCLFTLGFKEALSVGVVKALFAFITRGVVAGLLSFAGGVLSITVMFILIKVFKNKLSYLLLSVSGAISHNIGQFLVIMVLYKGMNMLPYLPVLIVSGTIFGIVTATLLKLVMPALRRL